MNEDHKSILFPKNFVWGAATASYQIEGAIYEDGKGESIWDRFSHIPGNILHEDTGDIACDAYHHTAEDVALMKEMGLTAYRFSIAWPRIFPKQNVINEAGLQYYDQLVDALLEANIVPYVTLYHWDLPQWLEDLGGWRNRNTAREFLRYSRVIFDRLGDRVQHWITLNEPWVVSFLGHFEGTMAPGLHDFSAAIRTAHVQLLAHGLAVQEFRSRNMAGEIGITLNLSPKEPLTESKADIEAAIRHDGYVNRWYLDPLFFGHYPEDLWNWYEKKGVILPEIDPEDMKIISQPLDFLGFNYYNIDYSAHCENQWPLDLVTGFSNGNPMSHYNMPITPWGLKQLLERLHRDYAPKKLYITENGISWQDHPDRHGKICDSQRIDYIYRHLEESAKAMENGVPLAGYFVWSLFDNFEWATGYENQFGLLYVDRKTMKRIPKESYYWYQTVAKTGRL